MWEYARVIPQNLLNQKYEPADRFHQGAGEGKGRGKEGRLARKEIKEPGRSLGIVYSYKEEFGRVNFTLLDSF